MPATSNPGPRGWLRKLGMTSLHRYRASDVLICAVMGVFAFTATLQGGSANRWHVMTWSGSTPEWNRTLHASGIRETCADTPQSCIASLGSRESSAKIFLAVPLPIEAPSPAALQYAEIARQNPNLEEVGFDNFTAQYSKLFTGGSKEAPSTLTAFIDGLKSGNSNLGFGIGLYEDDLTSDYLSDVDFPEPIRARVDYVYLHLHYRSDSPALVTYVHTVKSMFTNAKVVAGLYAYDRISVAPCASTTHLPCSQREEMNFFDTSLNEALRLLEQGTVAWVEFYPEFGGQPGEWDGWNQAAVCPPERRENCIANTKQMWQTVADKAGKEFQNWLR